MMMLHKLLLLGVLMVSIDTTFSHYDKEYTPKNRYQRSTTNLEYLMKVLEERDRLDKVDVDLLKQIQTTVHGTKMQEKSRSRSQSQRNIYVNHPRVSVLDRARTRQGQILGARTQNRSPLVEPKRNSPFSNRNRNKLLGGECQAFKTENTILKQQLLAAQSQQKQLQTKSGLDLDLDGPVRALRLLNSIQGDSNQATGPLDELLQAASKEQEILSGIQLSSTLITPTPTISTIIDTTSFVTTSTVTLTREIGVYFHGKRIPTHILDTEIQVQTVTSTLSRTIQITPTPSWQTMTISPTATQTNLPTTTPSVANINYLLAKQRKEKERQALIDRIKTVENQKSENLRSIGEVRVIPKAFDSLESLQGYFEKNQLKKEEPVSIFSKLFPAIPTTSVSTMYISGSIPGEYSTSLVTITLDAEGQQLDRSKRQVSHSSPQPLVATLLPEVGGDNLEDLSDEEILSSFRVDTGIDAKPSEASDQCNDKTVTVTVTVTLTRTCSP